MTNFNVGDQVRYVASGISSTPEYRGVIVALTENGYRVKWTVGANRDHSVDYPAASLELIRAAKDAAK